MEEKTQVTPTPEPQAPEPEQAAPRQSESAPPAEARASQAPKRYPRSKEGLAKVLAAPSDEDWSIKFRGFLFYFSIVGALISLTWLAKIVVDRRMERLKFEETYQAELLEKKQRLAADARDAYRLELGIFTFDLQPTPNAPEPRGVQNIVQAEITVECSEKGTCAWIKENMEIVRDRVQAIFVSLTREDLLSPEGKKRVRELILKNINPVLPKGKVEAVYFTKLLVS